MAKKQERTYDDTGMRNLMIAVLQDAVEEITFVKRRTHPRDALLTADWFSHNAPDWFDALGIGVPGESLRTWIAGSKRMILLAANTSQELAEIEKQINRLPQEMNHAL